MSPRRSRRERAARQENDQVLAAASIDAAIVYWRWLGEEFPRYAKAVSANLSALKTRPADARDAAARIARLTQQYGEVLTELPRLILDQLGSTSAKRPGPRARRQGRIID